MDQIADFNDTEMWIIRNAACERYGNDVELMMADQTHPLPYHRMGRYWLTGNLYPDKIINHYTLFN